MRPRREPATNNSQTYFITFQTAQRLSLFRTEHWCDLMLSVMQNYRVEFLLHDFVFMPDHVHLLLTPKSALERVAQLLKGNSSYRAKRELSWDKKIWQPGFSDHRLRDSADTQQHFLYIHKNIASTSSTLAKKFNGASALIPMDPLPQWLKPQSMVNPVGGTEVPPLQNTNPILNLEQ